MVRDPISELLSIADAARLARASLDDSALAFLDGGAADERALAANLAAFERRVLRPRIFTGVESPDLSVTLLGRRRAHPLLVAPIAYAGCAHPDGVAGIAHAAAQTGAVMCVSTLAGTPPGELAAEGARWFQLYVLRDRGATRALIDDAAAAGCEALVVTGDRPVLGIRDRERRQGLRATAATSTAAAAPQDTAPLIDPTVTWSDVERLAADGPLPVLVKGVLSADDAIRARDHGAAGVIVSNHGGRQLDAVPAALDVLAEVASAVGHELDVLVDGGVRRGSDVVVALALGARAVLVGRPLLWGLAAGGSAGARRVLEILLAELANAMTLVGAPGCDALDATFVGRAGPDPGSIAP